MRLTESTSYMMISTLNDPEEPFTPTLELVATSVTGCLTNIVKSAAGSSQDRADLAATTTSQEVRIANTGSKLKINSPTYSLASSFFLLQFFMTHFMGLRGKIKSLRKSNSHYKNTLWLTIFLSFQFVKKASEKLSSMSDAFFGRLVPSEDLVLKTPNMAISLKKVTANDAKGLSMGDGPSKFKLPSSLGNIGGGEINAKV